MKKYSNKTKILRFLKFGLILLGYFITLLLFNIISFNHQNLRQISSITNALEQKKVKTLKIYVVYTGVKAVITFKRGDQYDQEGLSQLNRLLYDRHSKKSTNLQPELFDFLWNIHSHFNESRYIYILSGFRAEETNQMLRKRNIKVARRSQHVLGKAVDFYIPGVSVKEIYKVAVRLRQGGVGYYPHFIHIDVGAVRFWL
ncbi:DUF882 domain-containing protein [Candidatus Liberibacter africanus]|uniref:Murein endopeptidase K n=2 Tax=Liberibacter africanus TaxID=34020 RepID=A0A0G3I5R6_LIBAF|nr:DUF882 domain-containing protein [Candidatus Liberibacter africanus]AKK20605.1 hypothetical protein G293_04950 [Candidatus Liberibacter africanus PTSAPSY]QTP64439.1 DUF882 domain-containing protein [Candidatus Liberibacter africanus]